eukprot:Phypoly_transcript_17827.p1 GENE.Phypoly_transcript_17827~~Phypoly_transcript_17827.p1  ORF type:complete len:104 (-),score=8.74 Phypoly_transcript_17827:37-348(-)
MLFVFSVCVLVGTCFFGQYLGLAFHIQVEDMNTPSREGVVLLVDAHEYEIRREKLQHRNLAKFQKITTNPFDSTVTHLQTLRGIVKLSPCFSFLGCVYSGVVL